MLSFCNFLCNIYLFKILNIIKSSCKVFYLETGILFQDCTGMRPEGWTSERFFLGKKGTVITLSLIFCM